MIIEPPDLGVGDVATVEITVVTPPEHRVRPVRPPREVEGFWLLDSEPLPITRDDSRWVHRTRIRARAREIGEFSWPALRVEVETPEQEVEELDLEGRPLSVRSVETRFPDRRTPFSFRAPSERPGEQGLLAPAVGGAGLALAAVALVGAVRRIRRNRRAVERERARAAPTPPAWRAAQATLEAALATCEETPEGAADAAAAALRHFFAQRFAVAARSLTTEELSALEPPLGADEHWPVLLETLASLDAVRFRPGREGVPALRETLARARQLVATAAPEARWR
ncbi:MAG: hypothetical protein ABFS46_06145 [Myxococcota bacterium]